MAGLLTLGLLGCLATFGPDLRARGVHGGLVSDAPNDTCMSCHESEADALARMNAAKAAGTPMKMSESGSPLVADWMVADERPCATCHRVRE